MSKPIAWVTGAAGLIGGYLIQTAKDCASGFEVVGLTRAEADLTDVARVSTLFREQKPTLIIHCAALSHSPICQSNPALARKLNIEVTQFLAELAADIPFVFFSSDLVFDGKKGNYTETDSPNPLSVYGETKVEAEQIVLRNPRHTVIRTSLNGGISRSKARGFNEELRNAWREGKTVKLFVDEFRCPIAATVTARAVWDLVKQNPSGIFHLAGAERLSRLQIGQLIAERHPELNPKVVATSFREYQGAPRPPDSSLNIEKIQKILPFEIPKFSEWLTKTPVAEF